MKKGALSITLMVLIISGIVSLKVIVLPQLERMDLIKIEEAERYSKDAMRQTDYEYETCTEFVLYSCGMMTAWEMAESELKQIRFCEDYHSCVIGCSMLVKMVETGVGRDGNITQGIYAINNKLKPTYGIDLDPKYLKLHTGEAFNDLSLDDFLKIDIMAGMVQDELRRTGMIEGLK